MRCALNLPIKSILVFIYLFLKLIINLFKIAVSLDTAVTVNSLKPAGHVVSSQSGVHVLESTRTTETCTLKLFKANIFVFMQKP